MRRRGLPMVVLGRVRGAALLHRAAPAVVFLVFLDLLLTILATVIDLVGGPERLLNLPGAAILALTLTGAMLVLPVLLGWLTLRWHRLLGPRGKLLLTGAVYLVWLVLLPVLEWRIGLRGMLAGVLALNLGLTVLLLGLVYVGAGSVLGWALRSALRQVSAVGTLASRALPLLLLFVLFAFFAGELWQAADRLPRAQLWGVVAFFAALCGLFIGSMLLDELREIAAQRRTLELAELLPKLRGTPLAGAAERHRPGDGHPVSVPERLNIALVLFFAQALQVVTFCVLVFVFFLVFGTLAVPEQVQQSWTGAPPQAGYLFGLRLPVSNALVQVSIFLAVFSGLYFAASTATDAHYRRSFFEPLLADVALSMAAREVYLQRWGDPAADGEQAAGDEAATVGR